MTTGIYKITNLVNSKVYIGASKNVEKRWSEHRNGRTAIAEDLQTFGLDNFKFEVLLECPEDMLCQWERDMIALYDADDPEKGYNDKSDRPYNPKVSESLKGKPSGMKGRSLSEETRRKISESRKGISHTEEERRKMSEALKGHKAWNKGLSASEETKRKLSEARKEYWRKKKELNGLKIHSNNEKQNKQI